MQDHKILELGIQLKETGIPLTIEIRNPASGIQNPQRGIQNPRLSSVDSFTCGDIYLHRETLILYLINEDYLFPKCSHS